MINSYEEDLYLTEEQTERLEDCSNMDGDGSKLEDWLRALGGGHSVTVAACYIRCNTRQDPPLGDRILRVRAEATDADWEGFKRELLHLIS